ncbi:MAG: DUF6077 domain-containing protein [Candidatus Binatia bacterium]
MRSGIVASVDTAVRDTASRAPAAPLSDRFCDAVVVVLALWTVCCHAVVAAGGDLRALLLLYGAVMAISLALWLRRRAASPAPVVPDAAATGERSVPAPWMLRAVALVAGAAVAARFVMQPDYLQLWWSAAVVLGLAAVALYYREPPLFSPPERSRSSEFLLWLLAAAAVVVTLIAHRPDHDDAFYVNVAVAVADLPRQALLSLGTMHGIEGLPLYLPFYRVHSYELLNGALSYLTGIPAIYCFHWLSAGSAALLVPLAYAKFFRLLTPRRWLATVATLMFVLVATGETHRWYGNFAFVRLWQGKAIFITVFTPLVYAYALRFAARPNRRDWAMLGAAQIAAVGCSASALWAAPVGAAIALCCAVRPSREGVRTVLLGGLASGYVLAAAWLVRASASGYIAEPAGYRAAVAAAPALQGALLNVLGDARLLIFGIATLLVGWVFAPSGLGRRFAVVAPLAMLLGLLNPYIADRVVVSVTGPSYWRSMWAVPLPILMALVLTSPLHLAGDWLRPGVRRAAWLVLLAAFACLIPRFNGLSPQNLVSLGWPALKVPHDTYEWAAAVNESVPPRSFVVAPFEVSTWIVTFHQHSYPVLVRRYLHTWGTRLTREELLERTAMQRFVDAPELIAAAPQQFRDDLARFKVRAVCLVNTPAAATARAILEEERFQQTRHDGAYELWVRTDGRRRPSNWMMH